MNVGMFRCQCADQLRVKNRLFQRTIGLLLACLRDETFNFKEKVSNVLSSSERYLYLIFVIPDRPKMCPDFDSYWPVTSLLYAVADKDPLRIVSYRPLSGIS